LTWTNRFIFYFHAQHGRWAFKTGKFFIFSFLFFILLSLTAANNSLRFTNCKQCGRQMQKLFRRPACRCGQEHSWRSCETNVELDWRECPGSRKEGRLNNLPEAGAERSCICLLVVCCFALPALQKLAPPIFFLFLVYSLPKSRRYDSPFWGCSKRR